MQEWKGIWGLFRMGLRMVERGGCDCGSSLQKSKVMYSELLTQLIF